MKDEEITLSLGTGYEPSRIEATVKFCYDPDSDVGEYRDFNYVAKVTVDGSVRERYFDSAIDANQWAFHTVEALWQRNAIAVMKKANEDRYNNRK